MRVGRSISFPFELCSAVSTDLIPSITVPLSRVERVASGDEEGKEEEAMILDSKNRSWQSHLLLAATSCSGGSKLSRSLSIENEYGDADQGVKWRAVESQKERQRKRVI
jgi:hypothetical protein